LVINIHSIHDARSAKHQVTQGTALVLNAQESKSLGHTPIFCNKRYMTNGFT